MKSHSIQALVGIMVTFCSFYNPLYSQVRLIEHGKSSSRIILTAGSRLNRTGAALLQRFIKESSNCTLPVKINHSIHRQPRF